MKENETKEMIELSRLLLEALRDMVSDRDFLSQATVEFAKSAIAKAEQSGLLD